MASFKYFISILTDFGDSLIMIARNHFSWFSIIIASIAGYFFGGWNYLTNQWAPLDLFFIGFVIVCFIAWFNTVAKKYQEVDDLKEKLDLRKKYKELGVALEAIQKKYDGTMAITPDSPIYNEIVDVLEKSEVVERAIIYFFKEGRLPPQRLALPHPNHFRVVQFQNLIDHALAQTF